VTILFSGVLILSASHAAEGQTTTRPFSDLGRYLEPGDTVFVVERERGETRGTLERLSPTALVLRVDGTAREFGASDVGWVERIPDPLWDGALWGGVFGYVSTMGLGGLLCASFPGTELSDCAAFLTSSAGQRLAAKYAGIYAAIGLLSDVTKRERWLVYGTRPAPARTGLRTQGPVSALDDLWSRVRPGDTVYMRDRSGRSLKGVFSRASRSSLTMVIDHQPRDIPADQIQQIWRRTSRYRQGMVVGPLVGAIYGAASPARYASRGETAVAGALLGWALGTTIGVVLPRRTTVYGVEVPPAVNVVPRLAPGRSGVTLSLEF